MVIADSEFAGKDWQGHHPRHPGRAAQAHVRLSLQERRQVGRRDSGRASAILKARELADAMKDSGQGRLEDLPRPDLAPRAGTRWTSNMTTPIAGTDAPNLETRGEELRPR
ncbi:hypothetical protein DdX_21851 [Ditylenchus destructor]|uniref:Uncharacterized protein n=1 Tax=Ditylenchus destructor TaxID=166010 RepID=A0AAD4MFQ3_9BILA|nr:hypothetical protein DdX_21851 [Ditylenchus destructor]